MKPRCASARGVVVSWRLTARRPAGRAAHRGERADENADEGAGGDAGGPERGEFGRAHRAARAGSNPGRRACRAVLSFSGVFERQ
ncbi:hypothetical protein AQ855_01715 [Burkholderia pseudomallei]|nr:hypothetical protein AQ854_01095 [Burkholderia pseudomallei]OMZ02204.1 hypothetical protein AQ855_01715 [Burkholderia pseudomallei]OMZ06349.1 hypothetical protein AQ856_25605 [Burkholderia pseudomallei]